MNLCNKFRNLFKSYDNWFRPKEIEIPAHVLQLLKTIYPTVNWEKVHFYNSHHWFIPSSQLMAIALPGVYDISRIHIYFRDFDPYSYSGLSTIVHEGFHVLQYTEIGLSGLGFFRPFMIEYLSCWILNGYENHPMEKDAYKYERFFIKCCESKNWNICNPPSKSPVSNQNVLNQLMTDYPDLVKRTSGFTYPGRFILKIPGAVINLLIGILIPSVEFVLLVIDLVLFIVTGLPCALTWLKKIPAFISDKFLRKN